MYSVAHVVRPRTATTEACLCFSLMATLPNGKPWERPAGQKDPSRSILLDLKQDPELAVARHSTDNG